IENFIRDSQAQIEITLPSAHSLQIGNMDQRIRDHRMIRSKSHSGRSEKILEDTAQYSRVRFLDSLSNLCDDLTDDFLRQLLHIREGWFLVARSFHRLSPQRERAGHPGMAALPEDAHGFFKQLQRLTGLITLQKQNCQRLQAKSV